MKIGFADTLTIRRHVETYLAYCRITGKGGHILTYTPELITEVWGLVDGPLFRMKANPAAEMAAFLLKDGPLKDNPNFKDEFDVRKIVSAKNTMEDLLTVAMALKNVFFPDRGV